MDEVPFVLCFCIYLLTYIRNIVDKVEMREL